MCTAVHSRAFVCMGVDLLYLHFVLTLFSFHAVKMTLNV